MIPSTFAVEGLLQEGAIGDLRAIRMLDKGWRPAGNSLMELLTHVFDLVRIYAGDPSWVAAHLTVAAGGPVPTPSRVARSRSLDPGGGPGGDQQAPQRLATLEDVVYSQTAWPTDRDCGLVLGDRCAATFGFGPREGWHRGLTGTVDSFFQPRTAASGGAWEPSVELLGTEGALFLGGTSSHVDVYLHRGPWAPPGRLERIESPPRPISPGPYAGRGAEAPHHTAMVEELVAAVEQGREHRSSGTEGRWALEMIMGVYEFPPPGRGQGAPAPRGAGPPPAALDRRGRGAPTGQARAPGEGTDAGAGRAGVGDAPPAPRASLASHARQLTAAAPRRGLTGRTLAPSPLRVTRARRASGPGGGRTADSWRIPGGEGLAAGPPAAETGRCRSYVCGYCSSPPPTTASASASASSCCGWAIRSRSPWPRATRPWWTPRTGRRPT